MGDPLLDRPSVSTEIPKTLIGRGGTASLCPASSLGSWMIPGERERGFASQLTCVPASEAGTQLLEVTC